MIPSASWTVLFHYNSHKIQFYPLNNFYLDLSQRNADFNQILSQICVDLHTKLCSVRNTSTETGFGATKLGATVPPESSSS